MQILLNNILDAHSLQAIVDTLNNPDLFVDGKESAGRSAKKVKSNLQAKSSASEIKGAAAVVEKALMAHPVFRAAALPLKFCKIMFNRYEAGMEYGLHVDDAIIADCRTDLSFTLFLSEPDRYEGGELVLQKHDGDEPIKLDAGALLLYPANTLHYIEKVRAGTRLAAVGWVQSRVRQADQREILFDLQNSLAKLADTEENRTTRLGLLKARNSLLRMWAD